MTNDVELRSERVVVDRLTAADTEALAANRNDPTVARFQGYSLPFTARDATRLVASSSGSVPPVDGGEAVQLAIRQPDATLVGDLMVAPWPGGSHGVELGITVGVAHQGRGFASGALRLLVAHLFACGIEKLDAIVAVDNTASLRVFDRLGFRREGLLHASYRSIGDGILDEVLFGLTRAEWARPSHDFDIIAFDADDTLWHSEDSFRAAELRFVELVSPFVPVGIDVKAALTAVERKNLHVLGYGVKAFGLSMVEAAISLSDGAVPAPVLSQLVETARAMLTEPVHLLDGVPEVLAAVGATHRIVLITKGDLVHQSAKIDTSGLAHHFSDIEIVMEKDPETYSRIITRLGVPPSRFCMVGNSVRSDILPVLSLGGSAVHIPYPLLWDLEQAPEDHGHSFAELESLRQLPVWLTASTTAPAE